MSKTLIPTSVYAEMTPNPSTMKFVTDRLLIKNDAVAEYKSIAPTKGSSELAEKLFSFPFVQAVFVAGNFITVNKNDSITWDWVTTELREFILNHLKENEGVVVSKLPEVEKQEENAEQVNIEPEINTDTDRKIVEILDEYVRPAVENDGGAIHFQSFKEGIVTVILKGSCSGCPSSTVTLKQGVETMLKQMVPGVLEVKALEM